MTLKTSIKTLAMGLVLAFGSTVATHATPVLLDDFNSGVINTATWEIGKHECVVMGCSFTQINSLCAAQSASYPCGGSDAVKDSLVGIADLGGGDFALFTQGDDTTNHWDQYVYSQSTYNAVDNLRCTWTSWWDPGNGSYSPEGSASGGGGNPPNGTAVNGPFHVNNQASAGGPVQTHSSNIEACVAREYSNTGGDTWRLEQDKSWGNGGSTVTDPPASAPIFSGAFHAAWDAANSKANGVMFRVWLDDTIGSAAEWSDDGGATWNMETDSREITLGGGSGWGAELGVVYLGWGTHHGRVYLDDVLLEDDNNLVPAELSEFLVD